MNRRRRQKACPRYSRLLQSEDLHMVALCGRYLLHSLLPCRLRLHTRSGGRQNCMDSYVYLRRIYAMLLGILRYSAGLQGCGRNTLQPCCGHSFHLDCKSYRLLVLRCVLRYAGIRTLPCDVSRLGCPWRTLLLVVQYRQLDVLRKRLNK